MKKTKELFKNMIFDKNTWLLFLLCSSFHLKIALRNFNCWEFIFRESLIFLFCWILVTDFNRRYLRKIDNGTKVSPAVNLIKYVPLGLGVLIFILLVTGLHKGVDNFFRELLSLVIILNFYFQLDNIGSIFIGENYIYFDYKVISINSLDGYGFKDNKELVFYKNNGDKISFKISDLSMQRKIKNELNENKLSELEI